jgi:predicted dienelactone hydrolase
MAADSPSTRTLDLMPPTPVKTESPISPAMNVIRLNLLMAFLLVAAPALAYDPLAIEKAAPAAPTQDFTVKDAEHDREIPIRIYLPSQNGAAHVVLFSHGLGGSRTGSKYLGDHWAARGYVAVFLQHPGSDESVWRDQPLANRAAAMRKAADGKNFMLRAKDVPVVLDQLEKWNKEAGNVLLGRMDLANIGMSGHSFGAVTTQAVSGQSFGPLRAGLTDSRIKAAIVFSPSRPNVGDTNKAFADVKIPWLLMTGTKDIANLGGAPIGVADMEARYAVFPALPAGNKYELVLDGAEHSVFTDRPLPGESGQRNPKHHPIILALSTAFWDAYLRGEEAAKMWLDGEEAKLMLGEKDRWQRK